MNIDGLFNGGQSEWYAYQHGMRGGPDQSVRAARDAADNFITGHQQQARRLAPKGCQGGSKSIGGDALYEFGQALHTISIRSNRLSHRFHRESLPEDVERFEITGVGRHGNKITRMETRRKRWTWRRRRGTN